MADLAKACKIPALCVKAMNLAVAVSVGHVDFAICGYGNLCWMIEGSAPVGRVAFAERREQRAITRKAEDLVRVAIGNPDTIEVVDGDAMRVEYSPIAIAEEKLSIRGQDDNRCLSPAQNVQTRGLVHGNLTDSNARTFDGCATPVMLHFV